MATIISVLNALAALPKLLGFVESFAGAVVQWWVSRQTNETLREISDAAALSARAKTPEEYYLATDAWARVLKRPRVSK